MSSQVFVIMSQSVLVLTVVKPKRVSVDEIAIKINSEWSWLYTARDIDTKLFLHFMKNN